MTSTTVTRVSTGKAGEAKSHKLLYTFPDGRTTETGGKIAARATHVVVVHNPPAKDDDSDWYRENRADRWGIFSQNGRRDLAEREFWKADGYGAFDHIEIVEVVEASALGLREFTPENAVPYETHRGETY